MDEICGEIKSDLARRGLRGKDVAEMLGVTSSTLSAQLSGRRTFGRDTAYRWAGVLGYSAEYLMTGEGHLLAEEEDNKINVESWKRTADGVWLPSETLELYTSLARSVDRLSEMLARGGGEVGDYQLFTYFYHRNRARTAALAALTPAQDRAI